MAQLREGSLIKKSTGDEIIATLDDLTSIPKVNVGLGSVDDVKQMPISGGSATGVIKAHSNASYTTGQVRNIILSVGEPTASDGENGDIWLVYE